MIHKCTTIYYGYEYAFTQSLLNDEIDNSLKINVTEGEN